VKNGGNTDDQRKMIQTPALIAPVTAAIEEDCRLSNEAPAIAHGMSVSTIHAVLPKDLGLEKKSEVGP
jgi:hypothetical protein